MSLRRARGIHASKLRFARGLLLHEIDAFQRGKVGGYVCGKLFRGVETLPRARAWQENAPRCVQISEEN